MTDQEEEKLRIKGIEDGLKESKLKYRVLAKISLILEN